MPVIYIYMDYMDLLYVELVSNKTFLFNCDATKFMFQHLFPFLFVNIKYDYSYLRYIVSITSKILAFYSSPQKKILQNSYSE